LKGTLAKLRSDGKQLFIITNAHIEMTDFLMRNTLGEKWLDYFDMVVCNARKPLF
jgi:FMN phosphatase YigB (HAD superfamily)